MAQRSTTTCCAPPLAIKVEDLSTVPSSWNAAAVTVSRFDGGNKWKNLEWTQLDWSLIGILRAVPGESRFRNEWIFIFCQSSTAILEPGIFIGYLLRRFPEGAAMEDYVANLNLIVLLH